MRSLFFTLLVTTFALTGCSSSSGALFTADGADAALADARARIAGAEQLDADTISPAEVRSARLKLADAEAALDAGNLARATRLAREATVDARLAEAGALAQRARDARVLSAEVRALQATIEADE